MGRSVFALGNRGLWRIAIGTGLIAISAAPAGASVAWTVNFPDPASFGATAPSVRSTLLAAGAEWSRYLDGTAQLEVTVLVDSGVPRAEGRSLTSSFVYDNGYFDVWDQGAASEVRLGIDPNGAVSDIEIRLSPTYLTSNLWFDPNPFARTSPVPSGKTDAFSVFLHEIGHALGFNGWRDGTTGALGGYGSRFDELTVFDGENFFFTGKHAQSEYGTVVPLTFSNIFHLGNSMPRPGNDLRNDLMNGVVFKRGVRYGISRLDLAMLADLGLPVQFADVPGPGGLGALGIGALVCLRRRR